MYEYVYVLDMEDGFVWGDDENGYFADVSYIDEDKKLFFNFIDDFGSANLEIQNKATERYIKETERRIKEAKEEFKEKYRLKLAFPLFISFVLAMVLI